MTQVPPRQITLRLKARTGLALAFIRLVSIPVMFGWQPSAATADRLARIAGRLVTVKAQRVYDPRRDHTYPGAAHVGR